MNKKIYRYSAQKYNSSLLSLGIIRVGTLYDFRHTEHNKGIADPHEGKKEVFHHIDKLFVTDPNDPNIKGNIDFKSLEKFGAVSFGSNAKNTTFKNIVVSKSFDVPDCFILCMSKICSKDTMHQFEGADSCVEIVKIESFIKFLTDALNCVWPVMFQGIYEVIYQNREENWNGQDWGRQPALIKETKFKKQGEIRAIWQPLCKQPIEPIIIGDFRLGAFCRNVFI